MVSSAHDLAPAIGARSHCIEDDILYGMYFCMWLVEMLQYERLDHSPERLEYPSDEGLGRNFYKDQIVRDQGFFFSSSLRHGSPSGNIWAYLT